MLAALYPLLMALQPAVAAAPPRALPPPGPIPGQCAEPARENAGKPGCYLAAELRLEDPPEQIRWHLFSFADEASARAEAARHRWSAVTFAHGQVWQRWATNVSGKAIPCGHFLPEEAPEETAAELKPFLRA